MSTGFAGSSTRGMNQLDREIEYRLGNLTHMDIFTDDFSPPGATDTVPGLNPDKQPQVPGKPHDDFPAGRPVGTASTRAMAAAGNARDQEPLDRIDQVQQQIEARIKKPADQFPGVKLRLVSGTERADNADTNEPKGERMPEEKIDGPESFHKEMERRMGASFQGVYKGVSFSVFKEGGGYYWKVGRTNGGQIFKGENEAVNAAKAYIEQNG